MMELGLNNEKKKMTKNDMKEMKTGAKKKQKSISEMAELYETSLGTEC